MAESLQQHYREKQRVTLVCAAANLALAVVKMVLGTLGQSQALVADGIHSLSDLVSDAMVLLAVRFASNEADQEHPYGHARFETVATVALGVLLLMVAFGIVVDAVGRMSDPDALMQPGWLALSGAVVSILVKEWMYRYNLDLARRIDSDLMRANAWHHRSDAVSSVVVVVGVAGSMAGYPILDSLAAIGVSLLIAKIGWDLGFAAVRELVDTGVSEQELADIRATICSIPGVQDFHDLRTRRMGQQVLLEVHILVGGQVTVSEGHMIGDRVRAQLYNDNPQITDVLVHVDPEDDASAPAIQLLPAREEVSRELERCWLSLGLQGRIERINLHYLGGRIDVEIVLSLQLLEEAGPAEELEQKLLQACEPLTYIGRVEILYRHVGRSVADE